MSTGQHIRRRSQRIAALRFPPGLLESTWRSLRRGDVLLRGVLSLLATVAIWTIIRGWAPPFPYRTGDVPHRDLVSRVHFSMPDEARTLEKQREAKQSIECIYRHNADPLDDLVISLELNIRQLQAFPSFDNLMGDPAALERWGAFVAPAEVAQDGPSFDIRGRDSRERFYAFCEALQGDPDLEALRNALQRTLQGFRQKGLLQKPQHKLGRQAVIRVADRDESAEPRRVPVEDVLVSGAAVKTRLQKMVQEEIPTQPLSQCIFQWMYPRLPSTLAFDPRATDQAANEAARQVPDVIQQYQAGDILAAGGKPLTAEERERLRHEHMAYVENLGAWRRLIHALSTWGMCVALFTLCGAYMNVRQPRALRGTQPLLRLLALVVVAVALVHVAAVDGTQAEIIPLVLFAMTAAIVYQTELALFLSAAVALLVILALGHDLTDFVVATAAMSSAVLPLRHVRNRGKLIYVGLIAGLVVLLTTIGVGFVSGETAIEPLLQRAGLMGFYTALAGLVMEGLLSFVESLFDVQTDLSLLVLGDVSQPLLQQLVRRAPGTYNHSINVASMAEAAADAIGANGLLVRVGAYFHDIGKMLEPEYFVENQNGDGNRHEFLRPKLSALVIIAHVKDGVGLAEEHHLPRAIIDFIQQHHGTTLVEYFYRQAKNEVDADADDVDEVSYRYPGPKPQTREAAVLMLADAVEGAARTLVDPAPSRIEGLVHDLAMKRLLDGQFDECGLTFRELATVEESLTKSLTAVYHGRVKYPDQQRAIPAHERARS